MGHFSITCSLTNLAILPGDECYLLFLHPAKWNHRTHIGSLTVCSNDGAVTDFYPYMLPILGKYNSYGSLEDIVKDSNTKRIEEIFGEPIEKFLQGAGGNHIFFKKPETPIDIDKWVNEFPIKTESSLSGCFIHKWAWDVGVKYMATKDTDFGDNSWFHSFVTIDMLDFAGFKFVGEQEDRFSHIYAVEGEDNLRIVTDGEFTHLEVKVEGKYENAGAAYSFADMKKTWEKHSSVTFLGEEMIETLKKRSKFRFRIDALQKLLKEVYEKDAAHKDSPPVEGSQAEKEWHLEKALLGMQLGTVVRNHSMGCVPTMYDKEILAGDEGIINAMCELYRIIGFFFLSCRLLAPALSGAQDGARDAERALLNGAHKFLKAYEDKQARYAEEEKREEEEEEKKEAAKKAKKRLNSKSKKSKLPKSV